MYYIDMNTSWINRKLLSIIKMQVHSYYVHLSKFSFEIVRQTTQKTRIVRITTKPSQSFITSDSTKKYYV